MSREKRIVNDRPPGDRHAVPGTSASSTRHGTASASVWRKPPLWERALLVVIVILPILAIAWGTYALWNHAVGPRDLWILLGMYVATTLGIGVGFHRMLTHRGFTGPAWIRFTMLALGSMALEGPPIDWAATHLKHHARSDKPGDPHSPLEGFWHAHVGWLFKAGQKVEPVYEKAFDGDRVAHAVSRTFWLWAILGFVIPFALGLALGGWRAAWSAMLWGGLVRVFFNHHVTWSVNSVCHTFGRQDFDTPDRSRNEWLVGLLALGEGWHNNHHAYPRSAVHGLKWYQFDLSGLFIRALAKLHVVRNVVTIPKAKWKADEKAHRQAP
jgi:stearoyl-CoA desaturase (delta-9 desaturase)